MSDGHRPDPNETGWIILWCLATGLSALVLALLIRGCMLAGQPHL